MKLNEALYKGEDRGQGTLPPERLGDYVAGDDAVRVVEAVFLNALLKMLKGDYKASNASCLPVFQVQPWPAHFGLQFAGLSFTQPGTSADVHGMTAHESYCLYI